MNCYKTLKRTAALFILAFCLPAIPSGAQAVEPGEKLQAPLSANLPGKADATGDFWQKGLSLTDGWTVAEVTRHPEFLRIIFAKGSELTGIEIVAGNGRRSDFCSPSYCIQPAPGYSPPVEVLAASIKVLPQNTSKGYPAVKAESKSPGRTSTNNESVFYFINHHKFLMLSMILMLFMLPVLFGLYRASTINKWQAIAALLVATGILVSGPFIIRDNVALKEIAILQDGTSYQNLLHLYGMGVHSSPFSIEIADSLPTADSKIKLPAVVLLNTWLTIGNSALFLLIASSILGSVIYAVPLTLVFFTNFATQAAATSEYPAAPATLLLLLITICGAVINNRKRAGRVATIAGLTAIGIIAILAGGLRPELGLACLLAFMAALTVVAVPEEMIAAAQTRVTGYLKSVSVKPIKAIIPALILTAFTACAIFLGKRLEPPASWFAGSFNIFNDGLSTVPAYLMSFLSMPLIALAVVGLVHTVKRPLTYLLLPVSIIMLLRLHVSAANIEFNHWLRLFTTDVPGVMLLAVFGLRVFLDVQWPTAFHRFWKIAAGIAVAFSVLIVPVTAGNPGQYPKMHQPGNPIRQQNPQIEVNYLLTMIRSYPNCIFTTRVLNHGKFIDMHFGNTVKLTDEPLAGAFECHIIYRSLDCNFKNGPDCADLFTGTTVVDELNFDSLPYGQISPYNEKPHNALIKLGFYQKK